MVEWLVLISVVSLVAFTVVFVLLGPKVTAGLGFLQGGLKNAVRNADVSFGAEVVPGDTKHPSSRIRVKKRH